jgi:hypothetical protein
MRIWQKMTADYLLDHLHQFVAFLLSVTLEETMFNEPRLQFAVRPRTPNIVGRGVIILLHLSKQGGARCSIGR